MSQASNIIIEEPNVKMAFSRFVQAVLVAQGIYAIPRLKERGIDSLEAGAILGIHKDSVNRAKRNRGGKK